MSPLVDFFSKILITDNLQLLITLKYPFLIFNKYIQYIQYIIEKA